MLRKTVIITGASGGIGGATAKLFAEKGYNLALTYNSNYPEELIAKLTPLTTVKAYKMNISDSNQIVNTFKQIFSDFEYVDCLVANAGVCEYETLLIDKTIEEIKKVIDVNLFGTILCNREALSYFMKNKHGSIVNIASICGEQGTSCTAVYSATKAGLITLSQSLAKEGARCGVRVNSISPGFIATNMTAGFSPEEVKACEKFIPLRRIGKPEEVASTIYFLASEDSSYITGQNISVNGGAVMFE